MTADEFLAFYPQFGQLFPEIVLNTYLAQANTRFSDFGEDAEEARRLYTAHKLILYAMTMPSSLEAGGGVSSFSALASSGEGRRVTSRKVDDVAVTYSSGASVSASSTTLADLAQTAYGQQLLTLLRIHSYPRYAR